MAITHLLMETLVEAQQILVPINMEIHQAHMEILEAQEFLVIVSPMAIAQHQVGILTKYGG